MPSMRFAQSATPAALDLPYYNTNLWVFSQLCFSSYLASCEVFSLRRNSIRDRLVYVTISQRITYWNWWSSEELSRGGTMSLRPERQAPPEIFYNDVEARKYTTSSRIIDIQAKLSERALELLALPEDSVPRLLLDIGCGSGLSGETLSEQGHHWIGLDVSEAMLDVALERETEGDLLLSDIGQGLALRPGSIDGAISISAVQWLCNADKTCNYPRARLKQFFGSLYKCLARGARAVLQIYPESPAQLEMISSAALRSGFSGGLVVDYPHSTRAKKYYLCLICGPPSIRTTLPKPKGEDGGSESEGSSDDDEEPGTVDVSERQRPTKKQKEDKKTKGRSWVLKKKEQRRHRGYTNVPQDTKYTGRKRKVHF